VVKLLNIEIVLLLNQTNKQFFIICPVKENHFSKTSKFISIYYSKYYNSISLNKDLVLSGIAGFPTNVVVIHLADLYSKNSFTNSALTVLTGYIVSKMVFAVLFQRSHHKSYTNRSTGKIEWTILKQIIKKMMLATFIFDFIDNGTKFIFIFEFLHLGFLPFQTVIISTIMSSTLSYLSINIAVKYIHVFKKENKS
jgi:hypothetical protein